MKKGIKIFGLLTMLAVVLSSCSLDNDDIDNADKIWGAYSTVEKENEEDKEFKLILDDGSVMEILQFNGNLAPNIYTLKDGDRIYAYFNIIHEEKQNELTFYSIRLNDYKAVLTKRPLYNSEVDGETVGTDPINVDKSWFGGDYLNVEFHYFANTGSIKHFMNLYVIADHPDADDDNIYVEMRHNAYGDQPYETAYGVVSFYIREFLPEGKNSVMVHFTYKNYAGKTITKSEAYSLKTIEQTDVRRFNPEYINYN